MAIFLNNFNSDKSLLFPVNCDGEISKNEGGNGRLSTMLPLSSLCPAVLAWLPKEFVKRPNLNNKLGRSKSTKPDKKVQIPKDIFVKDSKKFNCNQCAKQGSE